ncbi:hypothetical protein TSAR_016639, partial [Trichomalopsis sarcophagae]
MSELKKKYIFNDLPLTSYAKKKLKKHLKTEQASTNKNSIDVDSEEETHDVYNCINETNTEISTFADDESVKKIDYSDPVDSCDYSSDEDFLEILEKTDKNSSKITELFNEHEFLEPIEAAINRSPAELFLMTLKYALAYPISVTGIVNLMKLVNRICGKTVL